MKTSQKRVLPDKLHKITIKLKSYTFMKIFMYDPQQQKKHLKIRHYDLELEGAAHIVSWIKKRLQQVYLRSFIEIKDSQPEFVSLKYIREPQSPRIERLQFRNSSMKSTGKFRSHTDREPNLRKKNTPIYSTEQLLEQESSFVNNVYRSEYGGQMKKNKKASKRWVNNNQKMSQQSSNKSTDRKSNLQHLLQKVRKVNTQSKKDKQNHQQNEPFYGFSCGNSRAVSSHSAYAVNNNKPNGRINAQKLQQTMRLNTVNNNPNTENYIHNNNDLSFCTYGKSERVGNANNSSSFNNFKQIRTRFNEQPNQQPNRQSQNVIYTPVTCEIDQIQIQQPSLIENSNLISLKKWQRNQKRNVIMEKINELQKSLMMADSSRANLKQQEDDYFYHSHVNVVNNHNDDLYTTRDYYHIPANYSQGYLNLRTERVPVRSVVEIRGRK